MSVRAFLCRLSLSLLGVFMLAVLVSTSFAQTLDTPSITVNLGAVTKLQILLPGETAAPGTATGKTGAPARRAATPTERAAAPAERAAESSAGPGVGVQSDRAASATPLSAAARVKMSRFYP